MKKVEITDQEYKKLKDRYSIEHVELVLRYYLMSFPEMKNVHANLILDALNTYIARKTFGKWDLGFGCFKIIEFLDNKHNYKQ